MKRTLVVGLTLLMSGGFAVDSGIAAGENGALVQVPDRPFFLIGTERRFSSKERAFALVEKKGQRRVRLSVYRVSSPLSLLRSPQSEPAAAFAGGGLGKEAERLLEHGGRGKRLRLVSSFWAKLNKLHRPRRIFDETVVYDSFENTEQNVATYWVDVGRWASAEVPLGKLSPGLYLVRASAGLWVASSLLSIGELVVVVRRGDQRNEVWVTEQDGKPVARAKVSVLAGASTLHAASTDSRGRASLPASKHAKVRFVAQRGTDVAWTDVAHAAMSKRCDPRVYMGIGRPVYRRGETAHVRGNVRSCRRGRYQPAVDVPVKISSGSASVTVRTDAEGDFIAKLVAHGDLEAKAIGKKHHRSVIFDSRALPERELVARVSPQYAAAGQQVRVSIADKRGGWPRTAKVSLKTPGGVLYSTIGPGSPASFSFRAPSTTAPLERAALHATLNETGGVTLASAELWYGTAKELISVDAEQKWTANKRATVSVSVKKLDGGMAQGKVRVSVFGSDGNRKRGPVRATRTITLKSGAAAAALTLPGRGPWWIEARRGSSSGSAVIWQKPKPPTLSRSGQLAVQPNVTETRAGQPLGVRVRAPRTGWVLVTLERGGVVAHTWLPPARAGVRRGQIRIPAGIRGRATLVATAIRRGQVSRAESLVNVDASVPFELSVATNRAIYSEGETARVTLDSRTATGKPRDAVVSLWVADAGYWELGTDDYPLPTEFFRLMGRPASPGDSSRVLAYGSEEGRHLDTELTWNGAPLPKASFRHGWGYGGYLLTLDRKATLPALMNQVAKVAGLRRAVVCKKVAVALGRVALRSRNLPWDLVTDRIATLTKTHAYVEKQTLHLSCDAPPAHGGGGGSGFGTAGLGSGGGGGGGSSKRSLLGTIFFRGRIRLGRDGKATVDVPLPRHSGRWRVEALAIASDGGGDDGSSIVHTERPLQASVHGVDSLRVGDTATVQFRVRAKALAGQRVRLTPTLTGGASFVRRPPTSVRLDGRGRGHVDALVRAKRMGSAKLMLVVRSSSAPAFSDQVRSDLEIEAPATQVPLRSRAIVGPDLPVARVALPTLTRSSMLKVRASSHLSDEVADAFEFVRAPRWDVALMHLHQLRALQALSRTKSGSKTLQRRIAGEVTGALSRLSSGLAADGGLPWVAGASSVMASSELVWSVPKARRLSKTRAFLLRRARRRVAARDSAVLAAALAAVGSKESLPLARKHLRLSMRGDHGLGHAIWSARAAHKLGDAKARKLAYSRLGSHLQTAASAQERWACDGFAWFVCFSGDGHRGLLAQGARELLESGQASHRALVVRIIANLNGTAEVEHPLAWGSATPYVLELMAAWRGRVAGAGQLELQAGVRAPQRFTKTTTVTVKPGDREIILRGRHHSIITLEGSLYVKSPAASVGTVKTTRVFRKTAKAWQVEVGIQSARGLEDVELSIPLPAGLEWSEPASVRGGRMAFDEMRAWPYWFAYAPARSRKPRIERNEGGLVVVWDRLRRGQTRLAIPLVPRSSGTFAAPPARLRARSARSWALTAAAKVTVH